MWKNSQWRSEELRVTGKTFTSLPSKIEMCVCVCGGGGGESQRQRQRQTGTERQTNIVPRY